MQTDRSEERRVGKECRSRCRLTVGGETKFACVDGPDFDGHQVDFDEAMERGSMYKPFEQHKREETCNLFAKEVQ